ncbi:hypothetical protein BH11BAC2_BH11BAC2_14240 [soil metagenome]
MKKIIILILVCGVVNTLLAQDNGRNFWSIIHPNQLPVTADNIIRPEQYSAYHLDLSSIENLLNSAPLEGNGIDSGILLEVPLPDGTFSRFKVLESPVMHPDLSKNFPGIKTFSAQGIDDPSAYARFDYTLFGFHAMILSAKGDFFIEPFQLGNLNLYICYDKKYARHNEVFQCDVDSSIRKYSSANSSGYSQRAVGTQLKTYRLALACTGEYAAYYGGTQAGALSGIVTSINRVTGVYEVELSIRLVLIANNSLLIYTNASTDPYTNGNGSTMLGQNQTTITSLIGSANYDIGHVFSTGGGGVAGLGVVCSSGNKARGVTGSSAPIGDGYDIDYVAHEMGHQFGGNHTFNSALGSCAGGNRNASTAYESGSGITIMAYAGICGSDDLAPHSIATFHTASFDEITIYTTTGNGSTCPVTTSTGNTPPVVTSVGAVYSIPVSTPFVLTGAGTDPNGDPLTYCWEEYDLGAAGVWSISAGTAPLFRPFLPSSSPSRTFPALSDLINNVTSVGEVLPTAARTMKFRLTVRDNRLNGGGVMHPDTTLNISVVAGSSFSVTSPNTLVTWNAGTSQNILWNVAATNIAPFNSPNVKISLSVDGGFTYPYLLFASTPNDGSESWSVPNLPTTTARIKIESIGNIFFDISNVNFAIANGAAPFTTLLTQPLQVNTYCPGNMISVTYYSNGPASAGNIFTLELSDVNGSFSPIATTLATVNSVNSGIINTTIPLGLAASSFYRVRVRSSSPAIIGTNNGSDITINSLASAAGSISGTPSVCAGQSGIIYSIPVISGATGYIWSVPTGAAIVSGANTNVITVNFSGAAISGVVNVKGSSVCGNGVVSPNFSVTVINAPVISNFSPATGGVGTLVTINGSNMNNCIGVKFNGVSSTFTIVNNSQITTTAPAGGGTGVITLLTGACNVNTASNFIYTNITLNITVYIEGFYSGSGLMAPVLLNEGVSGATVSKTDTISVELHATNSPYSVISASKVVLSTNGSAAINLTSTLNGLSYYIAIKHRNGMQIWSSIPILFSNLTTYNFSTANSQSYGNSMKLIDTGIWAMYSGDISIQDEFIDVLDQSSIDNDAGSFAFGYYSTDVNGDGFVDVLDQALVDNNASLFLFSVHP